MFRMKPTNGPMMNPLKSIMEKIFVNSLTVTDIGTVHYNLILNMKNDRIQYFFNMRKTNQFPQVKLVFGKSAN